MASGDNWTKDDTTAKMRNDALKVLNKAKKQEVGGKWIKTNNTPPTMVYKKEKKEVIIKRFYHELTQDERCTLNMKLTQEELYTKYKQPEWCNHIEALSKEEGCPILQNKTRRGKFTKRHCDECMECEGNSMIDSDEIIDNEE